MEYDLRTRLETFASGSCSSEAFLHELSDQCAAAPDFVWDVLALTDQYRRRGKISPEFQRSVRELIERPALTQREPQLVSRKAAHRARSLPELVSFTPCPKPSPTYKMPDVDPVATVEPVHWVSQDQPAAVPVTAANTPAGQISVPTVYELAHVSDKSPATGSSHWGTVQADSGNIPVPIAVALHPTDIQLQGARAIEAAMTSVVKRPTHSAGALPVVLVAALLTGVAASSALTDRSADPDSPASAASEGTTALPASLSLSSDRYIVRPGATSVTFQVNRTGDNTRDINFEWWTRSAGAKSGKDYRGSRPRMERLPAGVNSMRWSIPILPNPARHHTELFYIGIRSAGRGASLGQESHATVFLMGPE